MNASQTTSDRVLMHLKTHGSASAQEIAAAFGITHMGAHKVLQNLGDAGLIGFEDVASGRGRPKRYYRLTEAGHARFPDRHAELTAELIGNIRDLFGSEGLDRLIARREADQKRRYDPGDEDDLEARVAHLARMRAAEGYMARVEHVDGDLMLIEDHCPICAAATACQGFCRSELNIFRMILGPDAEVTREQHLLSGGQRCAYRIRSRKND